MLALTIHHNVRLDRNQRYKLHEGHDLVVVGVSVPVWFFNKTTSEPAKEIFCKYYLKNTKTETPIRHLPDGYEITIPNRPAETPRTITNEQWRNLTQEQRDDYYSRCVPEVSSKNLLDIPDGGAKNLTYREQNQIKQDDEMMRIMHYVCIGDVDDMNT